jgi:predicted ATPase/DNA-binding winged helix-turn-helix (wHTH) protein
MTTREDVAGADYEVLVFGAFRLDPVRHVLLEAGKPRPLGGRALEILLALVERAGETVGTNELLARVWPDSVVENGTLRAHIAALRKILGDGESGVRYVENVSGQGYRFAAPVTRLREPAIPTALHAAAPLPPVSGESAPAVGYAHNLPAPLTRMVGRTRDLSLLTAEMSRRRFVTIAGAGGIGKTLLAVSVAQTLAPAYAHGVRFVDLSSLLEPRGVAGALASALGLAAPAADPRSDIRTFLQDKSMLVVIDNCEHVIEAAASLAEEVLQGAPGVHILATSREPLCARGESVHRLEPLTMPEGGEVMSGVEALAFPALQLFIERAEAHLNAFALRDADIPLIVEICRRLDGNPLAIELAAANLDPLGLHGLAASLDEGLHLFIRGHRTAVPRHQTLSATLDWSYELLSPSERVILHRLALFVGSFDQQSACAVVADETLDAARVLEGLTHLAAKSLIVADVTGEKILYQLLDTPRAYALEKLRDSGELEKIRRRHVQA